MQLLALGRRGLLGDPERVMVEQAERLDHVGHRDAPVPDDHEILAVLEIGGRGEIVIIEVGNDPPRFPSDNTACSMDYRARVGPSPRGCKILPTYFHHAAL